MTITSDLLPPREAQILDYSIDGYAYFNITGNGKEKGTILFHPLKKEINIILAKNMEKRCPYMKE